MEKKVNLKNISSDTLYPTTSSERVVFSDGTNLNTKLLEFPKLDENGKISSTQIPQATESTIGGIQLATTEEVSDGIDENKGVTPKTLKDNYVDLVSEQTIEGSKSFTSPIKVASQDSSTVVDLNNIKIESLGEVANIKIIRPDVKLSEPAQLDLKVGRIDFIDGDSNNLSYLETSVEGTTIKTRLGIVGQTSNSEIVLEGTKQGEVTAYLSNITIPEGDSSNKIATTEFISSNSGSQNLVILEQTSGRIQLEENKVYSLVILGSVTFVLPMPANKNILNQIKVQAQISGAPTINWGTNRFFNKTTPNVGSGNYDFYFDFDEKLNVWTAGAISKGVAD